MRAPCDIPKWEDPISAETLPQLRLYYVRVGFLASAYVNQVGRGAGYDSPPQPRRTAHSRDETAQTPADPSYDGYALYNWKRFRKDGPIALGNIDTIQNFVHLYDERWFILVHVEIEAIAAEILSAIATIKRGLADNPEARSQHRPVAHRKRHTTTGRGAEAHPRAHGSDAILQDLPALHPLLRECDLRRRRPRPHAVSGRDRRAKQHHADVVAFMKIPHRRPYLRITSTICAIHAGRASGADRGGRGHARSSQSLEVRSRTTPSSTRWRLFAVSITAGPKNTSVAGLTIRAEPAAPPIWNGYNRCWSKPRRIAFELQRQARRNGSAPAKEFEDEDDCYRRLRRSGSEAERLARPSSRRRRDAHAGAGGRSIIRQGQLGPLTSPVPAVAVRASTCRGVPASVPVPALKSRSALLSLWLSPGGRAA